MSKIRQAAQEGTIALRYFDESGFSCLPSVQRSWSPLGQPHTADASLGRRRVNTLGAMDYAKGKLHFALCEHNVRREHVIPFFDLLAQSNPLKSRQVPLA